MVDNYLKTAIRNFKSAKTLNNDSQFFNSCYLAGYILECYSKIILMLAYNMPLSSIAKEYKHDIKKLKGEIEYLRTDPTLNGLLNPTYVLDINTICPTILSGYNRWDPIKRYSDNESIWDQTTSNTYLTELSNIIAILNKMKVDGVI